ncbi:MAG: histidine kinase [Bacteroidales bacterium]|nr:histidine kinase [Bacteroidales bacterium]
MSLKQLKYWFPLFFWIFQIIVHVVRNIYLIFRESFGYIFNSIKITFPLDITTYIIFYYYFAPRLLKKEKLLLNILLAVGYFIVHSFIWAAVYSFFVLDDSSELKLFYFSSMGHTLLYSFYGTISRIAIDFFENREKQKELEKQNIKTELALLRSQIDPHFLFNTLNNINSFTVTNPEKASFATIKLSEIMRYMLYEASNEKVQLKNEINYIKNYLEIQQLRYKDKDFVDFKIDGNCENILIPPMLFIPFVENAFKHGSKSKEKKITINLSANSREIEFEISNFKRELNETEKNRPKGIGIVNIKRRLELLFPEKYDLKIIENKETFNVSLFIKL